MTSLKNWRELRGLFPMLLSFCCKGTKARWGGGGGGGGGGGLGARLEMFVFVTY